MGAQAERGQDDRNRSRPVVRSGPKSLSPQGPSLTFVASGDGYVVVDEEADTWFCVECESTNEIEEERCGLCGEPRPTLVQCSSCFEFVTPERGNVCGWCGSFLPLNRWSEEDFGVRPGVVDILDAEPNQRTPEETLRYWEERNLCCNEPWDNCRCFMPVSSSAVYGFDVIPVYKADSACDHCFYYGEPGCPALRQTALAWSLDGTLPQHGSIGPCEQLVLMRWDAEDADEGPTVIVDQETEE